MVPNPKFHIGNKLKFTGNVEYRKSIITIEQITTQHYLVSWFNGKVIQKDYYSFRNIESEYELFEGIKYNQIWSTLNEHTTA